MKLPFKQKGRSMAAKKTLYSEPISANSAHLQILLKDIIVL